MTEDPQRKGNKRRTKAGPRTDAILALLVVTCSVGCFAYRNAVAAASATDGAGYLMSLYASVASQLPAGARIGFVSHGANRTASDTAAHIAQNALAPRLVDADLTAVLFVITMPAAPQALDNDPRLIRFEQIGTSAGGIRIYRRRQ